MNQSELRGSLWQRLAAVRVDAQVMDKLVSRIGVAALVLVMGARTLGSPVAPGERMYGVVHAEAQLEHAVASALKQISGPACALGPLGNT